MSSFILLLDFYSLLSSARAMKFNKIFNGGGGKRVGRSLATYRTRVRQPAELLHWQN